MSTARLSQINKQLETINYLLNSNIPDYIRSEITLNHHKLLKERANITKNNQN